tara:strand:+ start:2319 stop:2756 length:438 start_codon:yes stop_codon:yes gene_type:complete
MPRITSVEELNKCLSSSKRDNIYYQIIDTKNFFMNEKIYKFDLLDYENFKMVKVDNVNYLEDKNYIIYCREIELNDVICCKIKLNSIKLTIFSKIHKTKKRKLVFVPCICNIKTEPDGINNYLIKFHLRKNYVDLKQIEDLYDSI